MKLRLALAATCFFGGIVPALAGHSTFQKSCQNIGLEVNADGAWISALCKKRDGTPVPTSLEILSLENSDGILQFGSDRDSSFQNSCRAIRLSTDDRGAVIHAICKDRDGNENRTAIELMGIENINGRLEGEF